MREKIFVRSCKLFMIIPLFFLIYAVNVHAENETNLTDNLKSSQWGERQSSAIKITSIASPVYLAPLIEALEKECSDPTLSSSNTSAGYINNRLKNAYQNALVSIVKKNKMVVSSLKTVLGKTEEQSAFYRRIMIILGNLGEEMAFAPLVNIVLTTEDGYDKTEACLALGRLGNRDAIPALRKVLNDPFEEYVNNPEDSMVSYPVQGAARAALKLLGEE